MLVELDRSEEIDQFIDAHRNQIGNRATSDTHIERLLAQATTATLRAKRLARVACLHYSELNLISLSVNVLEKFVQPVEILISAPQELFLFACQVVIRRMNGEIELVSIIYQLLLPPLHRLPLPASNRVLEYRATFVGDHQILVNADHLAVTFATWARSDRIIETEKVFGRPFEGHSVQFETRRVFRHLVLISERDDSAHATAQFVSTCHCIAQTAAHLLVVRQTGTIHHDRDAFGCFVA